MAIGPSAYKAQFKNFSVEELERELSSLVYFKTKEDYIDYIFKNYLQVGAKASRNTEIAAILELLKEKTGKDYSEKSKVNFTITLRNVIDYVANPKDIFWNIMIRKFMEELSVEIPEVTEGEKMNFLLMLYQDEKSFNEFTKEIIKMKDKPTALETYNKYKKIAREYCLRNTRK